MKPQSGRVPEVDCLRGIAILLMVGFHLTFDLKYFAKISLDLPHAYWRFMPELIGGLFFTVVGLTASIQFKTNPIHFSKRLVHRGLVLGLVSLGISVVSYWFSPESVIYFGALHCISLSLIALPLFVKQPRRLFTLGCSFIGLGWILWQFTVPFPYLLWLGLVPQSGTGGDWFSFFPYFGVVLVGFWLGNRFYQEHPRLSSRLPALFTENIVFRGLARLGNYSLPIYLLHQPVLLGLLSLIKLPLH